VSIGVEYAHLVRPDGSVVVPPEVADRVLRILVVGLNESVRRNAGGRPSEPVINVLHALNAAAAREEQSSSANGTEFGEKRTMDSIQGGSWVTCREAAALLQCTDRAIRKACGQGRIPATKRGTTWFISVQDLDRHRFGGVSRKVA
jgi:excisionase family DNA binding protein